MKTKKLIYLPLPRLQERYSEYVSNATGTFAACVKDYGVELDIIAPDNDLHTISSGVVLDTQQMMAWSFWQVSEVVKRIEAGEINNNSRIYIEDFWMNGMQAIPYACDLMHVKPKAFALQHAGSVDEHDFTYPMRRWMRGFERGWAEWLSGIFVSTKELKDMMLAPPDGSGGMTDDANKIHVTGLPYHRDTVIQMFPPPRTRDHHTDRLNRVLFTSRLDKEKQPELFMAIAKQYTSRNPDVEFFIVSGREVSEQWHQEAAASNVKIYENTKKHRYFDLLATSKVMLNTALQDFVSWAAIDCLAYGCTPLLPNYLTFPDVVGGDPDLLYNPGDIDNACEHLDLLLQERTSPYCLFPGMEPYLWDTYGKKYDRCAARMLDVIFAAPSMEEEIAAGWDLNEGKQ